LSKEKKPVRTISPEDAFKLIEQHRDDSKLIILDVRPHDEFEIEHIYGAKNLDYDGHEFRRKIVDYVHEYQKNSIKKHDNPMENIYIIYCRSGVKGEYFMGIMKNLGFKTVYNILGGFVGWKVSKLPLVK